jgi:hypothetical protein
MSESNFIAYVNNSFIFSSRLTTSRFSILLVFRRFFSWIALGDVDLRFSLILIPKANAAAEETT